MTTFHSKSFRARALKSVALVAMTLSLAGCASDGNSVLGGSQPDSNLVQNAAPVAPAPQPVLAKVTIAPIIGAPDGVGRTLSQDLASAIGKQKASVVAAGEKSDYTLRGYVVAAKDKASTKVSYIWDVTDSAGKRLNRITGEEIVPGQTPKDPWQAVSAQVTTSIAQKSAASFGAWLPTASAGQPAVASATPAAVGAPPATVQTASVGAGVTSAQPRPQPASVQTSAPATGGSVMAMVPSVTGAPGDGANSLSQALQSELTKNGVSLTGQQTATTYRVEGVVKVGASQAGKQPIQIDWNVKDPQGKKLGTVSQKNEIPEGSLDGAWGPTANAAAAAAAQGILKLLPR